MRSSWVFLASGVMFFAVGCADDDDDEAQPSEPRERFRYEVMSVESSGPGQTPTITFRVVDPEDGDRPYDIQAAPEFGEGASLRLHLGWPAVEFTNRGSEASGPAQPLRLDLLSPPPAANLQANADGSYTITSTRPISSELTGSGAVEFEGHPMVEGEEVPVETVVEYFPITDAQATPRREVVSIDKCNACHEYLTAHGNNRNNNIDSCVMCHNPSATDVARTQQLTPPGDDQPIDFKWMVHVIHAAGFRRDSVTIHGFGQPPAPHEFPIENFPGELSNCTTCHTDDTYDLPLPTLAGLDPAFYDTTVDANGVADITDNTRIPAAVAVCTSCHDQVSFTESSLPACASGDPNPESGCYHAAAPTPTADCATCHGTIPAHDVP